MTPRNFSWAVIVGFGLLFAGTVLANVFVDPQGVFGGDAAHRENPNWRYLEFKHYQRDASQIDGLVFASSRARSFDVDHLASRSGNQQILNFAVPFGLVTDHLPFLEYVLRDKKERGERLKSVLLLLDIDLFGKPPWTNTNIDAFLPPTLSGESPLRFWWRYLTAYQYGNWRDSLRLRYWTVGLAERADVLPASAQRIRASLLPTMIVQTSPMLRSSLETASSEVTADAVEDAVAAAHRNRRIWNARRPDLTRQISYLKQIIMLCRYNGVVLTVATSPMVRANLNGYPPGELEALTDELNRLTPIWDFASPPWLADSPSYWVDFSHFSKAVGTMMIDRMFGGDSPPPADFGRLRLQN
jgi:hypothetical protein